MTLSSSWWRVARGASQVASCWAHQRALQGEKAAVRLAQHGLDLTQKGADSADKTVQQLDTLIRATLQQQQQAHASPSEEPPTAFHDGHVPNNDTQSLNCLKRDSIQTTELCIPSTENDSQVLNDAQIGATKSDDKSPLLTKSLDSEEKPKLDRQFQPNEMSNETAIQEGVAVPATRIARAWGFAQLGASLAWGTARRGASRLVSGSRDKDDSSSSSSVFVHRDNADQVAATLCRMRGAALKLGQMLSIQDSSLLPPALHRALAQVRQGSTAMPTHQLHQQLSNQLGPNWRDFFLEFDERPTAAASIGQVHKAVTCDGQAVVVKVQFPGVAQSITSDLQNLGMLVKWSNLAPKGLFLDNIIRVGQAELSVECDYERELANQQKIKQLVEQDDFLKRENFVVPDVFPELSTAQILTSQFMKGGTIDKVSDLSPGERNRIGRAILYLTMQELFVWRFMQTDPNWGNFLYDTGTRQTALIDFGATRDYSKEFVDGYIRIVWAAANRDEETLMAQSHRMGFLTGEENDEMKRAHLLSGFTVGEPFQQHAPFDFKASRISSRMGEHTSVFLQHRLTAPPTEVYTLHRKLAGAYMLCIQLGAVVSCRDLLENIVLRHSFEDGLPSPL